MEAGIYHFQKSINLEPYLKELGVGFILRQLAQVSKAQLPLGTSFVSGLNVVIYNSRYLEPLCLAFYVAMSFF